MFIDRVTDPEKIRAVTAEDAKNPETAEALALMDHPLP
jgi:hypothetical protein